jgi:hypothetical protein
LKIKLAERRPLTNERTCIAFSVVLRKRNSVRRSYYLVLQPMDPLRLFSN